MTQTNLLREVLVKRVDYLLGLYAASGELNHSGEKGLLRELFLRRVIEAVLPKQFAVGSGVIVDRWNRQSPQVDLLVYDTRRTPPALDEHGHGIYPVDAVMRVIEVKSTLDTSALNQFRELAFSIHPDNPNGLKLTHSGNLPSGHAFYPLACFFAYGSSLANLETSARKVFGTFQTQAIFCSAERCQYFSLSEGAKTFGSVSDTVVYFTAWMLNAIEKTADSRHPYELVDWLYAGN
ncbi:MAG: DUF6602 domain-containing protein [Burkholderiales bacterium]